jgi:uncharacterized protein YcbX
VSTSGTSEVGSVASLHRYPVKSMLGEELQQALLAARGVHGDRSWGLVDDGTGKVVSVKRRRCRRSSEPRVEVVNDVERAGTPSVLASPPQTLARRGRRRC